MMTNHANIEKTQGFRWVKLSSQPADMNVRKFIECTLQKH